MRASREEGFTLLEVLVAFIILSGAVIAGFRIFSEGLGRLSDVEKRARATVIAGNQLSRLEHSQRLSPGTLRGSEGGYVWTATLTALGSPERGTVIPFRVAIDVATEKDPESLVIEVESVLIAIAGN